MPAPIRPHAVRVRRSNPPFVRQPMLFVGREPRRRLRKPAHDRHPFQSVEAADDPSLVSCAVYVVGLIFILCVIVFILLKSGGLI